MCRTVLVKGMPMKRFKKFKIDFMFTIYNKVTWGSLIINVLFFYYIFFCISGLLVFFFPFLFLLFIKAYRFRFFSSSYYLFKSNCHIITIISTIVIVVFINIMLINITVIGVLEKSSRGEFQAGNSSGMVYP